MAKRRDPTAGCRWKAVFSAATSLCVLQALHDALVGLFKDSYVEESGPYVIDGLFHVDEGMQGEHKALSTCWRIRVSGTVLGRDGVAVALWSGGCGGQSGDLVPGGESGGHLVGHRYRRRRRVRHGTDRPTSTRSNPLLRPDPGTATTHSPAVPGGSLWFGDPSPAPVNAAVHARSGDPCSQSPCCRGR